MIKLIRRNSDKKYLKSIENDLWVDDIKEAFEMTYRECENIKLILLENYSQDEFKEIVNLNKQKQISEEEKLQLFSLLRK